MTQPIIYFADINEPDETGTVSLELLERIATPCMGTDAEHLREGDIAELRAILIGAKP